MSGIIDSLNPVQREAATCTEGALLILAGAGSGKTRVLTHRIAYLIEEENVNPWNILAITFTNKAAQEMRDRVDKLVSFGAESIWVATFHSTCARILRRYIDRLGYENDFTIYDADDQKTTIKRIIKEMNLDSKLFKEGAVAGHISSMKNAMTEPEQALLDAGSDYHLKKEAEIYERYQKTLEENNALDFDDLLLLTVKLFREYYDVLNVYQERFRYIMVDEYQDTNMVQFELIHLLAGKYGNLCVVGDDDQSIYRFRGADIRNILSFEESYPGARVIKLEQNYRSTNNILEAANEVIANNQGRKKKHLWSENGDGKKVKYIRYNDAYAEGEGIANEVERYKSKGRSFKDMAILYRTNAQSRIIEEKFIAHSIPYKIVGGINFYQRQEIKDILAYLKVIDSGRDDLSVVRIINVPKRGIGQTTITRLTTYAREHGLRLMQVLENISDIPGLGKASEKVKKFVNQIMLLRTLAREVDAAELISEIIDKTGYMSEFDSLDKEKAQQKSENLEELKNKAADYCGKNPEATLSQFLEEVALVADIDSLDRNAECVTLMTLHGAKGLEFPIVFISGMEEGLFPSYMAVSSSDRNDVEEERRLCYVGITRAMEELTLTSARARMVHGETQWHKTSRFINELNKDSIDWNENGSDASGSDTVFAWSTGDSNKKIFGGYAKDSSSGFTKLSENIFDKAIQASESLYAKGMTFTKSEGLDYSVGDRVKHVKFGEGIVTEIKDMKKDYQVTVDFDTAGTKKMFAAFAKLKKV